MIKPELTEEEYKIVDLALHLQHIIAYNDKPYGKFTKQVKVLQNRLVGEYKKAKEAADGN
jgi:hypothetical protein